MLPGTIVEWYVAFCQRKGAPVGFVLFTLDSCDEAVIDSQLFEFYAY